MVAIDLKVDGDGAWGDLLDREVIEASSVIGMCALAGGMTSGRTSVAIRLDLPDGRIVFAQTSLRALQTVVKGLTAHYGDETLD